MDHLLSFLQTPHKKKKSSVFSVFLPNKTFGMTSSKKWQTQDLWFTYTSTDMIFMEALSDENLSDILNINSAQWFVKELSNKTDEL